MSKVEKKGNEKDKYLNQLKGSFGSVVDQLDGNTRIIPTYNNKMLGGLARVFDSQGRRIDNLEQ